MSRKSNGFKDLLKYRIHEESIDFGQSLCINARNVSYFVKKIILKDLNFRVLL